MENALDDLQRIVAAVQANQKLGSGPERVDRLVDRLDAATGLREAEMRQRIRRIERDHSPEHIDGVSVPAVALQSGCDLVVRGERVTREAELRVARGELR